MTQVFEEHVFNWKNVRDDVLLPWPFHRKQCLFTNLEFRRCLLVGVLFTAHAELDRRLTLRHIRLIDCQHGGGSLHGVIVEEALVDGLLTGNLISWGAVFKHVTLRGRIGPLMLSHLRDPQPRHAARQQVFAAANAAYYASVDWALDIREAAFEDIDLRGVPGHLVRRNPETQVLVTREKALEGKWRQLRLEKTYWPTALECFLKTNLDATVLVLPTSIQPWEPWSVQSLLDGLHCLRDEGVAEPD